MCLEEYFDGYISSEEIEKCKSAPNGNDNPIIYLFTKEVVSSDNSFGYTKQNVLSSYNIVKAHDYDWLKKNKSKLLDGNNVNNAMAVIGELCCYGYLLSSFGANNIEAIKPENKSTPDFEVRNDNGEKVYVEVNTIQMNGDEQESLRKFHSKRELPTHTGISIRQHCVTPFGRKNASCVAENVIHKLCQIKGEEKQFKEEITSVLWVDVQEQHVNMLSKRSLSSCPILTSREMIYSNELWYAFYGEKGLPIFENYTPFWGATRKTPIMQHDGRFHKNTESKIDAVVFCFPNSTIIYENPYSKKKLPKWFIRNMFNVRWFNYQGSKLDFPSHSLIEQLKIDKRIICSLHNSLEII